MFHIPKPPRLPKLQPQKKHQTPWQMRTQELIDTKVGELNRILIEAYEELSDDGKLSATFALQSFVDGAGLAKEAIQNMGVSNG